MRVSRAYPVGHRLLLGAALSALAVSGVAGCGESSSPGGKGVTLNVLDVAGNLQLTQGMIDDFVKQHSDVVGKVSYSKATAPELPGKIKAQQGGGNVSIDLVLTGVDGLSTGIEQGLYQQVLPKYADQLSGMKDYLEPAVKMQ